MKKVIIAVAFMLGVSTVNAQTFEKGTSVVQAGIGLGSSFGTPIGLGYEYGMSEKIGLGAYVGYASQSYSVPFFGDYKVTNILVGVKGNYHFFQSDKIDAYGGLLLGYDVASSKWTTANTIAIPTTYGGIVFGGSVGARYYFTDNIAAFAELGYGLGYLNAGLAYKL